MVQGIRSGRSTRTAHLETGRAMPTASFSWKAPMPMFLVGVPVARKITGEQEEYASSSPETRFVMPGPGLPWTTATRFVSLASAMAMKTPEASWWTRTG